MPALLVVRLCAVVLSLLAAFPVAARGAGDKSSNHVLSDDEEKPIFYGTATVGERAVEDTAASVTVVDREAIEASGAQTLAQILRQVPGIHISSGGPRGGVNSVSIRGGDPNFTFILLDGVPLNDITDPQGGSFNVDSLPASAIERVEVVRGPTSSFYGSTGLAGLVQVYTRRGTSTRPTAEVEIEGGSASLRRATVSIGNATVNRSEYFVGLSWDEENERIADESFAQWNLQGSAGLPLKNSAFLRLTGRASSWQATDYPEASGGPLFGSGELRNGDSDELSLGMELLLGASNARPGDNSSVHRISATWARHDLDRTSPGVFPAVPPSSEQTSYRRTRLGWTSTFLSKPGLDLAGGLDIEREQGDNESLLLLPPVLGGAVRGDYEVDRTQGGAHLQLLRTRGHLTLELGLRADFVEGNDEELSHRIGLSHRPGGKTTRLRASFGRAFKLPSFFALASPRALGGNPDLVPETTVGFDVGVEHTHLYGDASSLTLGLTVFSSRFEHLVDFDFDTFLHINRSRVDAKGIEFTFAWRPSQKLTLNADMTWQETEDQTTGEALLQRPDWMGSLRLTWRPTEATSLWLDTRAVSRLPDVQLPVPERQFAAAHETIDLAGSWRFSRYWELRARLDNLLNQDYETLIGFPGPSRSLRIALRLRI